MLECLYDTRTRKRIRNVLVIIKIILLLFYDILICASITTILKKLLILSLKSLSVFTGKHHFR